ncbi:MAG TPA: NAD(P)-dependent oxidoreductase [Alphaproteobacteria bacterium]
MGGKVGVIGLGIMGSAIATNLVRSGFSVAGYDVVAERREMLAERGVAPAASARAVAEASDVVITTLPSAAALHDTVGGDDGLIASGRRGLIVVECSTLPIRDKERARDALAAAEIVLLDCPLSGTGAQAAVKDLLVYGSGDRAAFDRCIPVFDGFSRGAHYLGPFGNGSKMKFVANLLVAIHNVSAAEAFVLGMKAGLDPETIYKVVGDGAGSSRMFQVRGPMMVKGDYADATMKVDVWQKDMKIIGEFAAELGCPTPLFSASASIYTAALAQGHGKEDTASVCAVLERLADLHRQV